MFKNVATKIALFAFDTTTGAAKTGDSANLTAYVSKDYGAVTVLGDTSATEMDATNAKGWYLFDVAQAESNADALLFTAKSSTANVSVVGQYIFTTPNRFSTLVIDAAGLADANMVKAGPTGSGTAQTAGDIIGDTNDIQARLPAALVGGRIDANVGAMAANTLDSSALAATAASEIATAVRTELTTELGRIDVATSTRASQTSVDTIDDYVDTEVAAIKAKTDNLPSDPADASDIAAAFGTVNATLATIASYVDTEVAAIKAVTDKLDNTVENTSDGYIFTANALQQAPTGGSAPTAADIADAVWEEAIGDHSGTSGSTAEALAAAGSAGDPWSTPLPGAYGAGTAGNIVGTNLDATVSSRATQASVDTIDDYVDTEVAAIKAKTDNLPSDPADASDIAAAFAAVPTATENADALLNRDMSAGTDSGSPTFRTPRQALRILRNAWTIDSSGVQTVNKEDDATPSWSQQLGSDPSADPVVSTDPAGP